MAPIRTDPPQPVLVEADVKRDRIRQKAIDNLKSVFPMIGRRFTVDAEDVQIKPADYGPEDLKGAILGARTLAEPIRGTLVLRNNKTGKVVQRVSNFNLLQLPYFTPHHTFLINGNAYTVSNQLRMRPGVYTRRRRNQEIEAQFNVVGSDNFRMSMDPTTGHFNLEYGATKVPLYSVLNKLGIPDKTIAQHWNPKLMEKNRNAHGKKVDSHINKLYDKLVRPSMQVAGEDKVDAIRRVYTSSKLDPETTQKTLGRRFEHVDPNTLLTTSQRLLDVYNKNIDLDERDNLANKRLLGVDDFIGERIKLDARNLKRKMMMKLDYGKADIKSALPSSPFSKGIRNFLSTSALSGNPEQINPIEIIDSSARVTSMGEGGITSDRAVPIEARQLHATHAGVLDPVRTPESHRAGIDLRTTLFTASDSKGNLFTALRNKRGQTRYVPIEEASEKIVAFPNQPTRGPIDVLYEGRVQSLPASRVDYSIPNPHAMYGVASNLIPFLDSIDGNRATMGSKMQTQALPLVDAEPPLIQVASYRPGRSMEQEFGQLVVPTAPVSGEVSSIRKGFIYIKPTGRKTAASAEKVPYFTNFPLSSKTYLHDDLKVKVGDKVKTGQPLADSPFAKDGQLSLGRNMRVAYVPLRGMNSNDALVISEGAAKKLTSKHMYREGLDVESDMRTTRESHRTYYGNKFPAEVYEKIDDDGVIKPGVRVNPGDLLVTAIQKTQLTPEARMLGRLHKSLVKPYKDVSVTWEHDTPGVITDVARTGNKIRLTVKTEEPLRVGDKLSGRYGNKGVVSTILPDDQMIQDAQGRPIDIAISPTSVVTRINPAQILETTLGRVAEKTGKPIKIENFAERDNVKYVKGELKKHGVGNSETIYDPQTEKKIPGVLVGPQYTFKLMKTTATNFSSRGVEDYDVNQQPAAGGPTGAKGVGRLEFNALLAHNARDILKETAALKSQRNDEWWRSYQLGLPTPSLKVPFAYDKFGAMLGGMNIKMNKQGNYVKLGPATDKETTEISAGEIKRPLFVRAKDLAPERGGFFDPAATGGLNGMKWSHVSLAEPVVNPVFERPVKDLLRLKQTDFNQVVREEGGKGIQKRLSKIDLDEREKEVWAALKKARADKRNQLGRELRAIRALKETDLRPEQAYVVSKIPVIPPIFRPIVPAKTGDLQVSDSNLLYRDAMIANDLLNKTKGLPPSVQEDARKHLYDAVSALYTDHLPVSPQLRARGTKGFLARISGGGVGPKAGFFHNKLLRRRQDLSARGTMAPDSTLALDEIGLPEDSGWSMYAPFVVRNLVKKGYKAMDARKMIEDRHPTARDTLVREMRERPILFNRAPSLYRYNVLAAYPKLVPGKTIRVPEPLAPIQAGDFDGDAVNLHVVTTPKAVEEATQMTLPNMLLSDQRKFTLTKAAPQQEAVMGVYLATKDKQKGAARVFDTKADAVAAYHRGEIGLNTPVTIKKEVVSVGAKNRNLDLLRTKPYTTLESI